MNIDSILSEFPQFELSYETMSHKKVYDADIILAIPDGTKFFTWFTTYNDENVCCLIDLERKNTQIVTTSFNDVLSSKASKLRFSFIFLKSVFINTLVL